MNWVGRGMRWMIMGGVKYDDGRRAFWVTRVMEEKDLGIIGDGNDVFGIGLNQ